MIFIGDSLTGGYYASTESHSFRKLVETHMNGMEYHLSSQYGVSAAQTLATIQSDTSTWTLAQYVIVELGTNDYAQRTSTQFGQVYQKLIQLLREREPSAAFVCLSLWHAPFADAGNPETGNAYNAYVQKYCPGTYLDITDNGYMNMSFHGPQGRSTWLGQGDWFHPNDQGHAWIAQQIEHVI